jgi:hypothetical protein
MSTEARWPSTGAPVPGAVGILRLRANGASSAHQPKVADAPPVPARDPAPVDRRPPDHRRLGRALLFLLRLVPAALGIAAWGLAVAGLDLPENGLYGLLAVIGPWYFVALGLIVVGFVAEICRMRPSGWVLGVHVVAVVLAIHATVPLAAGTAEYGWVYKHLGVAAALGEHGRVIDAQDIYQQWPGLFAALAAVTGLSGVDAIHFAAWAPLTFQLLNCLLLLGVFRALTRNLRVCFLAVMLYECLVSWVGQDYLSPQAFAYLLWLGILLVLLRWLRVPPGPASGRVLVRTRSWLRRDMPAAPLAPRSAARRLPAVLAVCAMFFVIVASHQLTPYVALSGVIGLTLFGIVRPRWLVLVLAAIALGYLATRYHLIESQFGGLFSDGDVITNASGTTGASWHSDAQALNALLVRALAVGMWIGAVTVACLYRRVPGRVLIPLILAFSPFVILLGQRYGGEAIYRVFLFSAPWCALLIASVLELTWRPVRAALVCAAVVMSLFAGLQDLYGQVAVNVFSRSEVATSNWLYSSAPPGSTFVLGAIDFPALQTANYADFRLMPLPSDPAMGEAWLDARDEAGVEDLARSLGPAPVYIVLSRTMANYAEYYGFPRGFGTLRENVASSPRWRLVRHSGDVVVYRFVDA